MARAASPVVRAARVRCKLSINAQIFILKRATYSQTLVLRLRFALPDIRKGRSRLIRRLMKLRKSWEWILSNFVERISTILFGLKNTELVQSESDGKDAMRKPVKRLA